MKEQNRIKAFDTAKGVGILGVIIGHHVLCMSDDQYRWLTDWFWSFHMPMFFIISGYFINPCSVKESLIKGIRQLIIPYYITVFLSVFVCIFILSKNGVYDGPPIFKWLFGCLILDPEYELMAMWFLPALFWGKLFFLCINRFISKMLFFSVLLLFFLALWINSFDIINNSGLLYIQKGLCVPIYLYIGQWMHIHKVIEREYGMDIVITMIMILFFAGPFSFRTDEQQFDVGFFCIITSTLISWSLIVLSRLIEKFSSLKWIVSFFSFFGKNSLYFLCSHAFLFTIQLQRHIPTHDTLLMGVIAVFVAVCLFPIKNLFTHALNKFRYLFNH